MKVLFLDFDGVLNSLQEVMYHRRMRRGFAYAARRFLRSIPYSIGNFLFRGTRYQSEWFHFAHYYLMDRTRFCPIACSNVQYLLEKFPDLRLVISSVWRSWPDRYLRKILDRNGIDSSRMIGITPLSTGVDVHGRPARGARGYQIQEWLSAHPEVGQFVIVDDDADMAHLIGYLVKTDGREGFSWRQVKQVSVMLGACADCDAVGDHEKYCYLNRPRCSSCGMHEDKLWNQIAHRHGCPAGGAA